MTNELPLDQMIPEPVASATMAAEAPAAESIAAEPIGASVPLMESEPLAQVAYNPPSSTDSIFNGIRRLGLVRTADRWIGGVAAGLAHRLGWDPMIVRGLFVLTFFFGGLGLIAYGVGWALLPEAEDGRIHLQEAIRGRFDPALVGAGLMVVSGMFSNGPFSWITHRLFAWNPGFGWFGGLFSALFWIVVAVLLLRWFNDYRRGRKYLKAHPEYAAVPPFPQPAPTGSTTGSPTLISIDGKPSAMESNAGLLVDDVETDIPMDTVELEAPVVPPVVETVIPDSVETDAGGFDRLNHRDAAAMAKAQARAQADQRRAYQRQQREIARYQQRLERSRKPITKGPGLVTVLLTLGSLFLVWTGFNAARHGFFPGMAGNLAVTNTLASPLLWGGLAVLVLGLGIFISGIRGRRAGILGAFAWLGLLAMVPLTFLTTAAFGPDVAWSNGTSHWVRPDTTARAIGSGLVEPVSLAQAEMGFRGQFGSPIIDLTTLDLSHNNALNPAVVPIEMSAGDVLVLVPQGAAVEANVRLNAGYVEWQTWVPSTEPGLEPGYFTPTYSQSINSPTREAVFLASDAAREDGANLRLTISIGAGNVTIREVAPVNALVSTTN